MSQLRAILDRMNDLEATISRVEKGSRGEPALATRLSLQSLEKRRELLREELSGVTRKEFVDICDYRIIPENQNSYAISAVTAALHDFQELVTLIFDALTTKPKQRTSISQDIVQKTQFSFGFAYSGSLGVVLTIQNDRLMLAETDLDRAVSAVFSLLKLGSADAVKEASRTYGIPTIRKLHHWTKTHSQYGMSADIKWIRDAEVRDEVLAQPVEMEEIRRIIEEKSETTSEPTTLEGELLAWNVQSRTFVLAFPEARPISGHWADDFEGATPRKVPGRYLAELTKQTTIKYAEEKDQVAWVLNKLTELSRPQIK